MLNPETIDIPRLRRDLREAGARARELKRLLRSPWQRPMAAEQREQRELARHVTSLCTLRASLRGKLHFTRAPREGRNPDEPCDVAAVHARLAERAARAYVRTDPAEPARAASPC